MDDHDVPPLAGAAVDAAVNFSVQDDAGTDAGAQRHQDQALHLLVLKVVVLPQGRAVRVVAQVDRHAGPAAVEHLRRRHGVDGDVHRLDDHAPPVVHRPGEAHAHRGHLRPVHPVLLHQGGGHAGQGLPHLLHGGEVEGHLLRGGDPVVLIHQSGLQVGAAYVNSNVIHALSSYAR